MNRSHHQPDVQPAPVLVPSPATPLAHTHSGRGSVSPLDPFLTQGAALISTGIQPVLPATGSSPGRDPSHCTPHSFMVPSRAGAESVHLWGIFLMLRCLEILTHLVFLKSFPPEHIILNFKALVPKKEESQFRRERLQMTSEICEEYKSQQTFGGA